MDHIQIQTKQKQLNKRQINKQNNIIHTMQTKTIHTNIKTEITKGTALYTSNFVRPEVKLSAVSGTSLLTGQDENYLMDYSTNNNTINRFGDVTYSTTVKPF